MVLKEEILNIVTENYLKSSGFNGIPIYAIAKKVGGEHEGLIRAIFQLVQDSKISLNFGDLHPNPHIKALKEEPIELQLEKFGKPGEHDLTYVCVYPTTEHMKDIIDPSAYRDRPL